MIFFKMVSIQKLLGHPVIFQGGRSKVKGESCHCCCLNSTFVEIGGLSKIILPQSQKLSSAPYAQAYHNRLEEFPKKGNGYESLFHMLLSTQCLKITQNVAFVNF